MLENFDQTIDVQSMQGAILTLSLVILATIFEVLSILHILQGISYFFAIVLAIDTLTGNKFKRWITNKLKDLKDVTNKYKSKRIRANKKL